MKIILLTVTTIITATLAAWGQDAVVSADTSVIESTDTSAATQSSERVDFAAIEAAFDEEIDDEKDFAEYEAEEAQASDAQRRLGIVRKDHNYGRQVKLAIVMMAFIVAALTTSQSWNPK